jgi:hypothetical protein
MTRPKAYDPQQGHKYQLLCRNPSYGREWEHCDHAKDKTEKDYLLGEYRLAYGKDWEFKIITCPQKYWKTEN